MTKRQTVFRWVPTLSSHDDVTNRLEDTVHKLEADGYVVRQKDIVDVAGHGVRIMGRLPREEYEEDYDPSIVEKINTLTVMLSKLKEEHDKAIGVSKLGGIFDDAVIHEFVAKVNGYVKSEDSVARKKEVLDGVRKIIHHVPTEKVRELLTLCEVELKSTNQCSPPCIVPTLLPDIVQALQEVTRSSTN
jgi:hypothetical protein